MTTSTMNESLMRITYNQIPMTKKVCNNNGVINNGRNITFINMIFFIVAQNYYILDASVKFVFSNTFLKFGRLIHLNFTTKILFFDSWDFRNSIFFNTFTEFLQQRIHNDSLLLSPVIETSINGNHEL